MEHLFTDIAIIVGCSAILAWLAGRLNQPIIVAYVLCGVLLGPWGVRAVPETETVHTISNIGVTLLLFMAGLVLHPQLLIQLLRSTAILTLGGCAVSWLVVFALLLPWGFGAVESALAAAALTFSSTILITKLMPTTTLHQRHMGSVAIAVLVAQDILAVIMIVVLSSPPGFSLGLFVPMLLLKTAALGGGAFFIEQFVLRRMLRDTERYQELRVLLSLGWCLGVAVTASYIGLTYEVGAFVAGIAMARSKLANVISEELKTVRDFFLVLFFFVLGAKLDLLLAKAVWLPSVIVALAILVSRPFIYRGLLQLVGERVSFAKELGLRMGQSSEFALVICAVAVTHNKLSGPMSQLVQLSAILTMVVSSYLVVVRQQTPLGTREGLKKD
jgi:Kef-type K+ transport system membrane component KefB